MSKENIVTQEIQFIESSIFQFEGTIGQVQSLILMLETIGSTHPQYYQLPTLNKNLQEITNKLNELNEIKNKLTDKNLNDK